MGSRIKDVNRIPQVLRRIDEMNRKKAKVGYFGTDYNGEGEISLKGIARVHEFGVTIVQRNRVIVIPERSFLRNGADTTVGEIIEKTKELIPDALLGNVDVEMLFQMLGIELKGKIQDFAIALAEPPNAESTIRKKKSSNPLVDSGAMIGAMEVKVE